MQITFGPRPSNEKGARKGEIKRGISARQIRAARKWWDAVDVFDPTTDPTFHLEIDFEDVSRPGIPPFPSTTEFDRFRNAWIRVVPGMMGESRDVAIEFNVILIVIVRVLGEILAWFSHFFLLYAEEEWRYMHISILISSFIKLWRKDLVEDT